MVNKAELRQFITQYFSDLELDELCFDYYPDILNQFTTGMTKSQKVIALIGYCDRRGLADHLLATLAKLRTTAYQDQFGLVPKPQASAHAAGRNPNQIFLSHANQDAAFARELAGDLRQNGFEIWMTPESIEPGEKWVDAIERGLETSGIFVLVITPHAADSKWVRDESNYAIALQNKDEMRLFTLLVGEGRIPPMWSVRQHISFREDYDEGLRQLLAALRSDRISARPLAPPSDATPPENSKTSTAASASGVATPPKSVPEPGANLTEARPASRAPDQQRKQVTILFADVSGFTALSETLDVEIVAGIMNDLWAVVDAAITGHGGRIDKHIGDAVMALWGAEAAREDDPEMAVRGALAMQAAIEEFCVMSSGAHGGAPLQLAMRIGVNTGPVLLGAVGTTGEFTAMGDAVNLASRLEHAAPAGGVLVSHDTYRHVRGVFDVVPQELIAVKGKPEPVQTYVVLRTKPRSFRIATRGVEGIETRMVGREAEMLILQSAYTDAIEFSETRVVTVIGDAGVGKSRLLYEFDNWIELRPEQVTYFKGRGTPNTQNIPHSLFRDLFAYRFDIRESDSAAVALAKFQSGMQGTIEPEQAAIAGHWLGFDFSANEAVSRLLGATGYAETARAYLTRYFRVLLAGGPVVVFLEDIHWADDSSLELGLHLIETLSALPMLVVALARPVFFERRPNWGSGEAAIQQIRLQPLSKQASRALVGELLQRVDDVPGSLRDLIIEAAEGNPYYVEELVKMLIDQGVIERGTVGAGFKPAPTITPTEHWTVRADKLEGLKVPATLTGLLQARLDSLPRPEREALQRASVVGRLFWDETVADLMQVEREAVNPMLEAVRGRELIFRRERSSFDEAGEYIFKHALLRDVAYETVLLRHRAEYHGRVARWLEAHAGERSNEFLNMMAEHYIQAGEGMKAAILLERAGQVALNKGAYEIAQLSFSHALGLYETIDMANGSDVIPVFSGLGQAFWRLGDFDTSEVNFKRAQDLASEAGVVGLEAEMLAWLSYIAFSRGDYELAESIGIEALRKGRIAGGSALGHALNSISSVAMVKGDLDTDETYSKEMLALAREIGDFRLEITALSNLGTNAADRRELELGKQFIEEGLELARRSNLLTAEAKLLGDLSENSYLRGDFDSAYLCAGISVERYREFNVPQFLIGALESLALSCIKLGKLELAWNSLQESLGLSLSIGYAEGVVGAIHAYANLLIAKGESSKGMSLYNLLLNYPGLWHPDRILIEEEIAELDLPSFKIQTAPNIETVAQEILDGEW